MNKKNEDILTIILSIGSWLLVAFWVYVLAISYIDHPYGMHKILSINQEVSAIDGANERYFVSGWSHSEGPTHRWTGAKESVLKFQINEIPDSCTNFILEVFVHAALDNKKDVTFYLNNHNLGKFEVEGQKTLKIPVSKNHIILNAANKLVLSIPEARSPGDFDSRTLGIAINNFKFTCHK